MNRKTNDVSPNSGVGHSDEKHVMTVAEQIAIIERLSTEHLDHFDPKKIKRSSKARAKWLRAVIDLSKTHAAYLEEIETKIGYLNEICEQILVPLAMQGIATAETFVIMSNMAIDTRAWDLSQRAGTRH